MAWWSSSRARRLRSWHRCRSRACGASASARPPLLADYGVRTIGDLAALPDDLLARRFGRQGPVLAARARGIDPSPVSGAEPARSVSHEHTFDVDTSDPELLERTLLALSEGVAGRLRAGHVRARTVAVKVRDASFVTVSRQRTLAEPSDETEVVFRAALELARPAASRHQGATARRRCFAPRGRSAAGALPRGGRPTGAGPRRPPTRSGVASAPGPSAALASSTAAWPSPSNVTRCVPRTTAASAGRATTTRRDAADPAPSHVVPGELARAGVSLSACPTGLLTIEQVF